MKIGWRILITFLCTALAVSGAMFMMLEIKSAAVVRLYRENLFSNIAFEVRQYVGQIESGLKYGRKLDNYFGIDNILSGCYTSSSYLRGVYVFDTEGGLLYSMGSKRGAIPNASAVDIDSTDYAVRTWQGAEYVVMNILGGQGETEGKLMISVDPALQANAISEQEQTTLIQSIAIAGEGILLIGILLIRCCQKSKKAFSVLTALVFFACGTLLPVCVDAAVQDIRFSSIAEVSTAHSVQRVSQMLQQQVDAMADKGVSPDVYDINGYLQRLQENVDNVASLRLNENGAIYAEPSVDYVNGFTAGYRANAVQYIVILFLGMSSLIIIAAIWQYLMNRKKLREAKGATMSLKHSPSGGIESVREQLLKKPLQNVMLLSCLNDGFLDEAYLLKNGSVCIHDNVSDVYQFAVDGITSFLELYNGVKENAHTLFINNGGLYDDIKAALPGHRILRYTQWMMHNDMALHIADIEGIKFIPLTDEYVPAVLENYHSTEFSPENVVERIHTQNSVGAVMDGSLIGFTLCHYNGEIGPVVVLPPYRRLGVGENLLVRISWYQREQGRPCFAFVGAQNDASQNMCIRAGYLKTPEETLWVYRD